jgi:hypothetical protein
MLTAVIRIKVVSASSPGMLQRSLEEGGNTHKILLKKLVGKLPLGKTRVTEG